MSTVIISSTSTIEFHKEFEYSDIKIPGGLVLPVTRIDIIAGVTYVTLCDTMTVPYPVLAKENITVLTDITDSIPVLAKVLPKQYQQEKAMLSR